LKHHYDECAERVKHQQEQHGKAEEDCVEECKSINDMLRTQMMPVLTLSSLPHDALRQPVCCTQVVQTATVNDHVDTPFDRTRVTRFSREVEDERI
jgi:hypothetical protein